MIIDGVGGQATGIGGRCCSEGLGVRVPVRQEASEQEPIEYTEGCQYQIEETESMELFGLYTGLYRVFMDYERADSSHFIAVADIASELEFHFRLQLRRDENQERRLELIFERLEVVGKYCSDEFLVMSILRHLDGYFESSVGYCNLHVIAAQQSLDDLEFPGDSCLFNSATIEQTLADGYCDNIRRCRSDWYAVSSEFKEHVASFCYTVPERIGKK